MDKFEAILDDLGEGFYGDEMQKQRTKVDPERTGKLSRDVFVDFFVKLASSGGSGEDDDDDEIDEEVLEEERENARVAFDSVDAANTGSIDRADFQKLIESLGTTYCEEEHRRTIKRLSSNSGKIQRGDFVEWFARWVTGGEDDDDDDDDDGGDNDEPDEGALAANWQRLSAPKEGQWKCEVCSVFNQAGAQKCAACETPNPTASSLPSDAGHASAIGKVGSGTGFTPSSAISGVFPTVGSGGFTFSAANQTSQETTTLDAAAAPASFVFGNSEFSLDKPSEDHGPGSIKFNFGLSTQVPSAVRETENSVDARNHGASSPSPAANPAVQGVSFSFGKDTTAAGGIFASSAKSSGPAPSFSFGAVPPGNSPLEANSDARRDASGAPSFSFSFTGASSAVMPGQANFSFSGKETQPDSPSSADTGTKTTTQAAFSTPPRDLTGRENVVDRGTRSNAALESDGKGESKVGRAQAAFDAHDPDGKGVVGMETFDAILDDLGEGFYGEEMEKQRSKVDPEGTGKLSRDAFVNFFVRLVSGEQDDDEGDDVDEEELEEEREYARVAFDSIDSASAGSIDSTDFHKVIEALGTTYCEEEHRRTLKRLSTNDGKIQRSDFVEWYAQWVTGEEDEDDDDPDGDDEAVDESALAANWQRLSGPKEGQWKCQVCSVYNDVQLVKCAACETPNPDHPSKSATNVEGKPSFVGNALLSTSGLITPSGFTFIGGGTPGSTGLVDDAGTSDSAKSSKAGSPADVAAQPSLGNELKRTFGDSVDGQPSAPSTHEFGQKTEGKFIFGFSPSSQNAQAKSSQSPVSDGPLGSDSISFGMSSGASPPKFSFGMASLPTKQSTPPRSVEAMPAPFSLGAKDDEKTKTVPFRFGSSGDAAAVGKPSFSFGGIDAKPTPSQFSFGMPAGSAAESKPTSFAFSAGALDTKAPSSFSFGSTSSVEPKPGFSFGAANGPEKSNSTS